MTAKELYTMLAVTLKDRKVYVKIDGVYFPIIDSQLTSIGYDITEEPILLLIHSGASPSTHQKP